MKLKKRLSQFVSAVIIIFGVTFLTFLLSYLSPDDAAVVKLSAMKTGYTQEMLELTRDEMGLNAPFIVQYGRWMKGVLRLDFGTSYRTNEEVSGMILSALPRTLSLTLLSMLIMLAIAVPTGLYCAAHPNGAIDRLTMAASYLFCSLPSFFIALVAMYFLCIRLKLFNVRAEPGIKGLIMPAAILGVTLSSWYIRQIRSIAIEQISSEYVKCLRARGISKIKILTKHVLKNCLTPIITLLGISIGGMLGGSAIVESIFSVGGVGSAAVEAVTARDYPFIQAYAFWMAIIYLLVNLLVDITNRRLDPRIR
jgi:peptide/nickel transport system permease protein